MDWVNSLRLSYQDTSSSTTTTSASPQYDYTYYPNATNTSGAVSLINVGGPGSGIGAISSQKGFNLNDDFTFTNFHWYGDHTLKLGAGYGDIKLTSQNSSSDIANATYYYAVTPSGVAATPDQVQFPVVNPGYATGVTTHDKQYSLYAQDDWDVDEHLELNIGLRMDHEVVAGLRQLRHAERRRECDQRDRSPAPTRPMPRLWRLAASTSTTISARVTIVRRPTTSPPAWASPTTFHGDGSMVLFGGYGRSYNRNQFGTLALETTKVALNNNPQIYFPSAQTQDSFGACATPANVNPANHCYAWNSSYLTPSGPGGPDAETPRRRKSTCCTTTSRTPYSDQFSVGVRNRIGEWNTQETLSYVESYDEIVGHLGNRYSTGAYYEKRQPVGRPRRAGCRRSYPLG